MDIAVLLVGVAVERFKHKVRRTAVRCIESVDEAIERLPDVPERHPCTGTILCQRTGSRHKAGCIGKTPPFEVYARELGSVK